MVDQHRPDDLASLRAEVTAQRAELLAQRTAIARLRQRRRLPRRALPLFLAVALVALIPLATLAANPVFSDLGDAAEIHQADIVALGNAGISTGVDDPKSGNPDIRLYNPKDLVTREEMATFLARTAGLGTNPPVVNAKTAQTAVSATSAETATNAQNAATLGGQPPSAFLPAAGNTTYRYPGSMAIESFINSGAVTPGLFGEAEIALDPDDVILLTVPLPRATSEHGRYLAVTSLRVCYQADTAGIGIVAVGLYASERADFETILIEDTTPRTSTDNTCFDLPVPPQAVAGMTYAQLVVANGPDDPRTLYLDSLTLTLTPQAAGVAEQPGNGGGGKKPAR